MKFDVILHGETDFVNNFDRRIAKLADLINIDINFIGPFLGARESTVMSNLEFTEARNFMAQIHDLGFKAEVRPGRKKEKTATDGITANTSIPVSTSEHLILNQNRARFNAPTDLPNTQARPLKERVQPAGSTVGKLEEADTAELALASDEDKYSSYNWSRDTASDEVVVFEDNLVIKKGR